MSITRLMFFAAAGLIAASPALAQNRGPNTPGRITIENARSVALVELKLIGKEGTKAERVVAQGLLPGKKLTVTLPARSGCVFDIEGAFSDEATTEAEDRNLCRDKVIRLVE